jgi:putative FmdB family regulatory protein
MPLYDYQCSQCGEEQERFSHGSGSVPSCASCGGQLMRLPLRPSAVGRKTAVFPFTTPHLDGKGTPIVVESLGHLRSLERRYGVCVTAFSNNPGNPDSPRDLPRQRPGGRDFYE